MEKLFIENGEMIFEVIKPSNRAVRTVILGDIDIDGLINLKKRMLRPKGKK